MQYGFSRTVDIPYERAIERVTEELKKYVILGACNPPFAFKALQAEEEIGLLLPCNVIVYEKEGKTVVSAFDPLAMTAVVGNDKILPVAQEVWQRLERVIQAL